MAESTMNQASSRLGDLLWERTDATHLVEQTKTAGAEVIEQVRARGQQTASALEDAARQGVDRATAAAEELAGQLREQAAVLPGRRSAELVDQAAGGLERGALFLRRAVGAEPQHNVATLIRRYRVQLLVVGLILGFFLASAVRRPRS